jgi:cytidylate kinase
LGAEVELVIAIDGSAGSGKSTLAKSVAMRLNWPWLSTGVMYRAATLAMIRASVDPYDSEAVLGVILASKIVAEGSRVSLDDEDVSDQVFSSAVSGAVSSVSRIAEVRSELVTLQRAWLSARSKGVVEGRDIGTVVFPDAVVKIYLDADLRVRGDRRPSEGASSLARRDLVDSSRLTSPLIKAVDAIELDSGKHSPDELTDRIVTILQERVSAPMIAGQDRIGSRDSS